MDKQTKRLVNTRLSSEIVNFIDQYRRKHRLSTRTEVITEALKALQERERAEELAAGYRAMAEDYGKTSDPFLDSDLEETLEAIDRG